MSGMETKNELEQLRKLVTLSAHIPLSFEPNLNQHLSEVNGGENNGMNNNPDMDKNSTVTEKCSKYECLPYNPNEPSLDTITFKFEQESNCVDGGEGEILIVEAKSSLGIDGDGGAFYVLKTEQWAFSDIDELVVMLKRVEAALNATKPTSIHVK